MSLLIRKERERERERDCKSTRCTPVRNATDNPLRNIADSLSHFIFSFDMVFLHIFAHESLINGGTGNELRYIELVRFVPEQQDCGSLLTFPPRVQGRVIERGNFPETGRGFAIGFTRASSKGRGEGKKETCTRGKKRKKKKRERERERERANILFIQPWRLIASRAEVSGKFNATPREFDFPWSYFFAERGNFFFGEVD